MTSIAPEDGSPASQGSDAGGAQGATAATSVAAEYSVALPSVSPQSSGRRRISVSPHAKNNRRYSRQDSASTASQDSGWQLESASLWTSFCCACGSGLVNEDSWHLELPEDVDEAGRKKTPLGQRTHFIGAKDSNFMFYTKDRIDPKKELPQTISAWLEHHFYGAEGGGEEATFAPPSFEVPPIPLTPQDAVLPSKKIARHLDDKRAAFDWCRYTVFFIFYMFYLLSVFCPSEARMVRALLPRPALPAALPGTESERRLT